MSDRHRQHGLSALMTGNFKTQYVLRNILGKSCTVLADIKWTLDSGGIGRRAMTGRFDADNKWWNGVSGYKYDYCAGCKSQPIQYGAAKGGSNNAIRYRRQFKMVECSD